MSAKDPSIAETVNGYRINKVEQMSGLLFTVEGTDAAFLTLAQARRFAAALASPDEIQEWFDRTIEEYPLDYPEELEHMEAIRKGGVRSLVEICYAGWSDEAIQREDPDCFRVKKTLRHLL